MFEYCDHQESEYGCKKTEYQCVARPLSGDFKNNGEAIVSAIRCPSYEFKGKDGKRMRDLFTEFTTALEGFCRVNEELKAMGLDTEPAEGYLAEQISITLTGKK